MSSHPQAVIKQAESDGAAIEQLESSGRYRVFEVLHDLSTQTGAPELDNRPPHCIMAMLVDFETTGMNAKEGDAFEIGYLPIFLNEENGAIVALGRGKRFIQDPGYPIDPGRLLFCGRTEDEITGKNWPVEEITQDLASADFIVAHSARFDRQFADKHFPGAADKPWACSLEDVAWKEAGLESTKLEYLSFRIGSFVYDGHQALEDVQALALMLHRASLHPAFADQASPFKQMLDSVRQGQNEYTLYALNAPFESKDLLKAAGYRWSDGSTIGIKSWHITVPQERVDAELDFLKLDIYKRANATGFNPLTIGVKITSPNQRYSQPPATDEPIKTMGLMALKSLVQEAQGQRMPSQTEAPDSPTASP